MISTSTTIAERWALLASSALLGTDRRSAPVPPPGPLETLWHDRGVDDIAVAVLDQVVAITAMRRAGLRPAPAVTPLQAAPSDARPLCSAASVDRLADVLERWPVLVDQWLDLVQQGGRQLPADAAVELLARWRADANRHALVVELTGGLPTWLIEMFPTELAPRRSSRQTAPPRAAAAMLTGTGEPAALPADLPADLADLAALDAEPLAAALSDGLQRGTLGVRHRPGLVALLLAVPAGRLLTVAGALERSATNPATMGLTVSLADLARTRFAMIEELTP
jgi:hypothetical protein